MSSFTGKDFVGIESLIQKHREQISKFQSWAKNGAWTEFHHNHYDWWTFPIDQPSKFGFKYVVQNEEISELLAQDNFRVRHALGAELLLQSWGWDWESGAPLLDASPDQRWMNWPIRLFKCTRSMKLFRQDQMYEACMHYAQHLYSAGESFTYLNRNLAEELHLE